MFDIKKFLQQYRMAIRFIIVGVLNTLVDFGCFLFCYYILRTSIAIAQILGFGAGIFNSFVLNKIWTFENSEISRKTPMQFVRFILVNLLSLSLSLVGLTLFTNHQVAKVILYPANTIIAINGFGLKPYIAKIVITPFVFIVNYIGYKLWVFNKPEPDKTTNQIAA